MIRQLFKLWVCGLICSAMSLQGGTPHLGYGTLRYADGTTPASVTFSSYVTARPAERLTQSSFGCSYSGGTWTVQVGNFPTAWRAGEILHVDFNDGAGKTGSVELSLTNEPADDAGKTVLSQNPVAKLLLPDIRASRGSQVDIPVSLQGLGIPDSILGYQITLKFDPAVLIALDAKSTGTMTQNWGEPTVAPREDRIVIAGFTANTPLVPAEGRLVYATFLVHGVPTNPASYATAILFEDAMLYVQRNNAIQEVIVSHIKTGTVTVDPGTNPATRDIAIAPGWNLISLGIAPSPN
ncbi:MAG TPA: hypothetical protein ENN17_00775, partial [bacterium]|nr:hypothetical protein [bacterium]